MINTILFSKGGGGYSAQFNSRRLSRVAEHLNIKYAGQTNLGSTWISTPEQFRLVSYLTLIGMSYLALEEFTQPEKEGKVGVINWPEWHFGVLLLYGQHLALNHLIASNQLNIRRLNNMIDYPSGNTDSIYDLLHIHVFHGDSLFSKFAFKMNKYDNTTISDSDSKYEQVKYYALKMALEGKRKSCKELNQMLKEINSKKT